MWILPPPLIVILANPLIPLCHELHQKIHKRMFPVKIKNSLKQKHYLCQIENLKIPSVEIVRVAIDDAKAANDAVICMCTVEQY